MFWAQFAAISGTILTVMGILAMIIRGWSTLNKIAMAGIMSKLEQIMASQEAQKERFNDHLDWHADPARRRPVRR